MSHQARLDQLVTAALQDGFFTHSYIACGLLDENEPRFEASYSPPGAKAQIYDLASLTKALVTGPLVHQLLSQEPGKNLAAFLNESDSGLRAELLQLDIEALLGHYSGLPAWWNFWMQRLDEGPSQDLRLEERRRIISEVFARIPLDTAKQDIYSDLGYILLGTLLEQLQGQDLAVQFKTWLQRLNCNLPIAYPMQLKLPKEAYIPSAYCHLRQRLLTGEVHDENCAALGGIAAHAGLFSSGPTLVKYLQTLYREPSGAAYLEANQKAWRDTQHEGLRGLRRGQVPSAQVFAEGQAIGHLGFTGTAFWLHLPSRRYGVFLSNRVISGRVSARTSSMRRQVFEILHDILS